MRPALRLPFPLPPPASAQPAVRAAMHSTAVHVDRLVRELRARRGRLCLQPAQRRLRPEQVAAGYGIHGANITMATTVQAAAQAAGSAGEAIWDGAGAAVGLVAGASAPVETVKTLLEVGAGRRKAMSARLRAEEAAARLVASRRTGDRVQQARDWLDHRHGLESWVATRRCFQGTLPQLRRRRQRWRQELLRLEQQAVPSPAAVVRRARLERRLQALTQLGLRRVVGLRTSAVSVEKRFKEGVSAGRNAGGLLGIVSGLAAGGSPFLAFVATVFMPLLLPVLLLMDGVAGSVEATQLIRRARVGQTQLDGGLQRVGQAVSSLRAEPEASPGGLFRRGLEVVEVALREQSRSWRRELWQGWIRRVRSAAFVLLAPVALGLGAAALVATSVTPAGWAVAALLGAVVVGYCIAQAVLNHRNARQARAVVVRQQDHVELARRAGLDWAQRTGKLADPLWSGNEYLAVELLVRVLVEAARDPADRATLGRVLGQHLAFGQRWRQHVLALAQAVPEGAAPDHPDVWRLSEALMRRFGLPVPKSARRPGAL